MRRDTIPAKQWRWRCSLLFFSQTRFFLPRQRGRLKNRRMRLATIFPPARWCDCKKFCNQLLRLAKWSFWDPFRGQKFYGERTHFTSEGLDEVPIEWPKYKLWLLLKVMRKYFYFEYQMREGVHLFLEGTSENPPKNHDKNMPAVHTQTFQYQD